MYYTTKKRTAGVYGTDTYSASSPISTYSPSSSLGSIPLQKKNLGSSRCCGRGCKPCVDDLGM